MCLKSIFLLLICSCAQGNPQDVPVTTDPPEPDPLPVVVGAERMDLYLPGLEGRRVAVVGNQTSMVQQVHLVDTLIAQKVNVIKVFSPEHGFRGDADAGEHVSTEKDERTGLPIVSLYGKNKKPTGEQMKGIDIVLFDIQDVGVRFYTYISTLHYVMEACAENNVKLIVLDRPNPNGNYVDGPVLDPKFTSFVGMHPIPIVHGMTIAEYAGMINGEHWLPNGLQCELEVVTCENYDHETMYSLPIPPSPNLRSDAAIQLYPSLCLLEATTVTVGRGTDGPFERYGHPDFPETGFSFVPKPGYGSKDPKHNGVKCNGYNLKDSLKERPQALNLEYLEIAYGHLKAKMFDGKEKFFNLLAGNDLLIQQIRNGTSETAIRDSWKEALEHYKNKVRPQYLLYP